VRGAGRVSACNEARGPREGTRLITAHGSREDGAWTDGPCSVIQQKWERRVGGQSTMRLGRGCAPSFASRLSCGVVFVSFVCAPAADAVEIR
jgi:hypothetical protein